MLYRMGIDDAGEPAQTGSLIHLGISAYHDCSDKQVAEGFMVAQAAKFPAASISKARRHLAAYCTRERAQWGTVIHNEKRVQFTLDPHPTDKTREEIYIEGTLDQIRGRTVDGGRMIYSLVDMKTGMMRAEKMLHYYTFQLAAYRWGAWREYKIKCDEVYILRTTDFIGGGPVMHPVSWTFDDTIKILEVVRLRVAEIRNGLWAPTPGDHCNYCRARSITACINRTLPDERASFQLLNDANANADDGLIYQLPMIGDFPNG
jgi:hypothetical protein